MNAEQKKKRTFKKFTYRGVDLDKLLDMSSKDLMELVDVSVCVCEVNKRLVLVVVSVVGGGCVQRKEFQQC